MTQRERILNHLERFGEITDIEAYSDYGIRRLGARIWDFRRDGYQIKTEMVEGKNRYGETTRYAKYILERGEGNNGQSDGIPVVQGFGENSCGGIG